MNQSKSTTPKSLKDWQTQHILKGREQARLQEFVPESEWRSVFQRAYMQDTLTKHSDKS